MPFDSTGPGSIIPVRRVAPIYAQDVGDGTAGNDANLQTFVDARRFVRAKVADLSTRNSLPSPQDGDLVLVLDNGTSQTQIDRYKASTATWVTVAVEGGGGGGGGAVAAAPAYKEPVRVATAAALPTNTRATNVLTASVNGVLPAIDGVSLSLGDRLLVKNEAAGEKNGLYVVTSVGSGATPWSLTRSDDADTEIKLAPGILVPVSGGTVNGDAVFTLTTDGAITLGTTSLAFARLKAGDALTLGGLSTATAATASTIAVRGSDGTLQASNHESLGAAGSAGSVIVADAGGKVPAAALPETNSSLGPMPFRVIAIGGLAAIAAADVIAEYAWVVEAGSLSAIDLFCPTTPSSGSISVQVSRLSGQGGTYSQIATASLTCAGGARYTTATVSPVVSLSAGDILSLKVTEAPVGAVGLYAALR